MVEPGGAVGLAALLAGRIDAARQERRHRAVRRQCGCGPVCAADQLTGALQATRAAGAPNIAAAITSAVMRRREILIFSQQFNFESPGIVRGHLCMFPLMWINNAAVG